MVPSGESQLSLSYLSSDDRLVGVKCTSHAVDIALNWYSKFQGGRTQAQSIFFVVKKRWMKTHWLSRSHTGTRRFLAISLKVNDIIIQKQCTHRWMYSLWLLHQELLQKNELNCSATLLMEKYPVAHWFCVLWRVSKGSSVELWAYSVQSLWKISSWDYAHELTHIQ